ncbi:crotonase/enoyl-CoA hydratase family protein [Pseudonocardia acaciae]|uniref:crotonase/enoyl-CoA hydratase family protein n=1 Tax=Pseudonocardia acaciae TaxID=551276 RepID=UPI000566AEB8|nr:crotonase/enoyl-CoA hydratase family protein [Pseudonocardia acaciae]
MTYSTVETERDGSILLVRLNRPDRLNAYTNVMHDELIDVYDKADADDEVRAIVVTGAGRAFCAGADLGRGGATFAREHKDEPHRDTGGMLNLRTYQCTKPLIAAINGPAVGVGATMTLPMDIRLAADTAKIGFVFARRGIVADGCASWFLPRVVGIAKALEWTLTGRVFDAAEAHAAGLVRSVHPADELLPAALDLAREIAENTSAVSVTLNRQLMWRMLGADHPMAAHEVESRTLEHVGRGPDAREGVESFLEKRPPRYPGRVPSDLPDFYPWWDERPFTPLP